jgi:hypothetical protein
MAEPATHAMADAVETATAEMADSYDAVVETHAVIDDVPPGTHAMVEAEAKFMAAAVIQPVGIAVIILARRDAAVSRVVYETSRTRVGLGGSRLRSGERNRGHNPMAVANTTALVENLLRVIAATFGDLPQQFKLIPKWAIDGPPANGE